MKLLDFFRGKRDGDTASIAKERLSLIIAHDHLGDDDSSTHAEYLPKLKQELLEVICKYVSIDEEDINVRFEKTENRDTLELNINIPNQTA